MSDKTQILLNSKKNVDSIDVDTFQKFELSNILSLINEYDIKNALSATEIFDAEREASEIYRIYGRIEYLSLLNGLSGTYNEVGNFFLPETPGTQGYANAKTIFNSFDFYLLRPSTGYTKISGGNISSLNGITLTSDFKNWTSSLPSNYPEGWTVAVTTGSQVVQSLGTQAKFTLGSLSTNTVTLTKNFTPIYGNFTINTSGSITPYLASSTDYLKIKIWSNATLINTFDVLTANVDDIFYNFSLPESTPLTKITITAACYLKTIYMDYFRVYQNNSDSGNYVRQFEVIATPASFELYNAGFTNNVYGEQVYAFNYNTDFDVSPYLDEFGFPLTELFLYPKYQPGTNGNSPPKPETMSATTWNTDGTITKTPINNTVPLSVGDKVYGDLVAYSKPEFFQEQSSPQTYYITTPYKDGTTQKYLEWKYNPFISLRLRYFSDDLNGANTGSTTYAQQISIPYYATDLGDGNYVWKNILPQGFIDPITNLGVDYPFINKKRYLFAPIILDISPNLNHDNTYDVFSEIEFGEPTVNNTKPKGNLDNIGKPCQ